VIYKYRGNSFFVFDMNSKKGELLPHTWWELFVGWIQRLTK